MPTMTAIERTGSRERVTRREVLRHAAQLFAERGYRSTNLREVAERLGVTRQALYYHFGSKSEILGALFEEQMTALEAAAASAEPSEGTTLFAAMLREHLKVILSSPDLMAVLVHERPETDRIDGLRSHQRRRAYNNQFAEAYAAGVKQGALRPVDSLRAANAILAAANSVPGWYHPARSTAAPKQVLDDMVALLSSGFALG
jgi:TetR/AcrR family transcriptional regulator, cholesterol catabolism regulator